MVKGKEASTEVAVLPKGISGDVPDYVRDMGIGALGMEEVTSADMKVPRFSVAQKMSPEVDPDRLDSYIEGLALGTFFNTMTRECFGKGPAIVTPIKLYMERRKFVEGGGTECVSYNGKNGGQLSDNCETCPHSQFSTGADGKSEPPTCDKFWNILSVIHAVGDLDLSDRPIGERIAVISLKSKGLKVAKRWFGLMQMRNRPIYLGAYRLSIVTENAPKGAFYNLTVENAGYVSEAIARELEKQHSFFAERVVDAGNATAATEPAEDGRF